MINDITSKPFGEQLKKQLLHEFNNNDRNGIYAYTQKYMAYNSNKIEGSTLNSEQTALLFDTGTLVNNADFVYRAKDIEEMTGHFKMFNEILKSLDKPLSVEMIKSFHYQLKSGVFEDYANGYPIGEFKNRRNSVSDIETELPENVPARISSLVTKYNNSPQTLNDIADFHIEYESIHPFQDGNGRTGRAIIFKQCIESGLIPVIISDDDKIMYYRALNYAQKHNDHNPLLKLFEMAQDKYYRKAKDFLPIPNDKAEQASEVMNGFVEQLISSKMAAPEQISTCDSLDTVRCIIRHDRSVMAIDFLQNTIVLCNSGNVMTSQKLMDNDKQGYDVFCKIADSLKEYIGSHNYKAFNNSFSANNRKL